MKLRFLDGWRGVCALGVALGHLGWGGQQAFGGLFERTHTLVDGFFVLSGFIITVVYGGRLTGIRDLSVFLVRRAGRLWPLYAIMLAVFVLVEAVKFGATVEFGFEPVQAAFTESRPAEMLLPTLAMLQTFGIDDGLTWNFPAWSAAAEFWTCVVFGVLLVATTGKRHVRLAAALLVAAGAAALLVHASPHRMDATYDYGFVRALYGFSVGVVLETVWRSGRFSWLKGTPAELAAAAMLILFVGRAGGTPAEFAAPAVFALALLVLTAETGAVSHLLMQPALASLGRWSYSISLVHALVLTTMVPRTAAYLESLLGAGPAAVAVTTLYLATVIAISALTYRCIEMPGIAAARTLSERLDSWFAVRRSEAGIPAPSLR